ESDLEERSSIQGEAMELQMVKGEEHGRDQDRAACPRSDVAALRQLEDRAAEEQLLLERTEEQEADELSGVTREPVPDPMPGYHRGDPRSRQPRSEPQSADPAESAPVGSGDGRSEWTHRTDGEVDPQARNERRDTGVRKPPKARGDEQDRSIRGRDETDGH